MQEWLRPILNESLDNGRDLEQLRDRLDAMLATYRRVEETFADGRGHEVEDVSE
jgi:hypothetical protein